MKYIKILTILTLIFNSLILIGAGHGFGPLFLFEALIFTPNYVNESEINLIGTYDQKIIPFAFFSIIFQNVLIISLFAKNTVKKNLIIISLILLLSNLLYFTFDFTESSLSTFSLISAIPFIVTALILFVKNLFRNE